MYGLLQVRKLPIGGVKIIKEKQVMKKEINWPYKKQSAAMLCVMLDAEFIWLSMDEKYDTPKHRSVGEYGPRRGLDRILALLKEYNVKATFFVPGIFAEFYADVLKKVISDGHEIALHGYKHEDFTKMPVEEQKNVIQKGLDALENLMGKKPSGFRLPEGGCTEETLSLICESGFKYDNSFFDHDIPYVIEINGKKTNTVEIPTRWELIDFPYLAWGDSFTDRIAVYDDVLDNWLRELEASYDGGYCYVLSVTPQTIGSPGRMFMLRTVLEKLARKNIWIATGEEIASFILENDK